MASHTPPTTAYFGENRAGEVIACSVVFTVIVTLSYVARLISARFATVPWGMDDYLMIPGMALFYAFVGCSLAGLSIAGLGQYIEKVALHPEILIVTWKYAVFLPMITLATIPFPKIAILCLYLQIFTDQASLIISWLTVFVVAGNAIGGIVAGAVTCVPLHKLWEPETPGHCININAFYRWATLAHIVTDVVMLVLPVPTISNLKTTSRVKWGLLATFLVGGSGLIMSCIRFSLSFRKNAQADTTWVAADLIVYSVCETGFYLLAACWIRCKPLLTYLVQKIPGKSVQSHESSSYYPVDAELERRDATWFSTKMQRSMSEQRSEGVAV